MLQTFDGVKMYVALALGSGGELPKVTVVYFGRHENKQSCNFFNTKITYIFDNFSACKYIL